jgi:hypothetical protein
MEKNGINKEIRMCREFTGAKGKSLVNEIRRWTGTGAPSKAGATAKADHAEGAAAVSAPLRLP